MVASRGSFVKSFLFSSFFLLLSASHASAKESLISHHCLDRQEIYNTATTIHIGAAVDPSIAVNPQDKNHIVACWQQDRISNGGGSLEAGIAYSQDGGNSWHTSAVPFQICSHGFTQRVSEVWLSFSKDGKVVYLAALFFNATREPKTKKQEGVVVCRSLDGGASWSKPSFITTSEHTSNDATSGLFFNDKTTVTADPNKKQLAYTVWQQQDSLSSFHVTTQFSRTKNQGKKWSKRALLYDPFPDLLAEGLSNGIQNDCGTNNNIIFVLPKASSHSDAWKDDQLGSKETRHARFNGDVLNFTMRQYATPGATDAQYTSDAFPYHYTLFDFAVIRSENHGKTWQQKATVISQITNNSIFTGGYTYDGQGNITGGVGSQLRTIDAIASCTVNPANGFLYAVWHSSEFRQDKLPQIALSCSRDGGHTWSAPVQVSRTPTNAANPQAYSPFVAVAEDGRVGILYFDLRKNKVLHSSKTKVDAFLAVYKEVKDPQGGSTGAGLDFVDEARLSKKSYIAQNAPLTATGLMLAGDYQFLTSHKNTFYAIYTKSFRGPFKPAKIFFTDPAHQATILLDNNKRQAPFVSIVDRAKHGKLKIRSTTELPFKRAH